MTLEAVPESRKKGGGSETGKGKEAVRGVTSVGMWDSVPLGPLGSSAEHTSEFLTRPEETAVSVQQLPRLIGPCQPNLCLANL